MSESWPTTGQEQLHKLAPTAPSIAKAGRLRLSSLKSRALSPMSLNPKAHRHSSRACHGPTTLLDELNL